MSKKPIQRQFASGSEEEAGSPMEFGTPPQSTIHSTSGSFDSGLSENSCRKGSEGDVSSTHGNQQKHSPLFIMEEITGIKQSLSDIGEMVKMLADRVTSLQQMVLLSSTAKPDDSEDLGGLNQPEYLLDIHFPKNWQDRGRRVSDGVLAADQRSRIKESWKALKSWATVSEDAEEKVGEKLSPQEQKLRSSVKCNLSKFIEQTNWKFIVPHLVSVDLSDKATTEYLLNETRTDPEKGAHFYLLVLPFKGDDAYCRFYGCLRDEKEHLGHKSLLQILNE